MTLNWVAVFALSLGLLVFGMVRYAATQTPNLLVSKVRAAIMAYLRNRPGASITELRKQNQLSWGSVQHHLYLLERAGLITSFPMGRARMFFSQGLANDMQRVVAVLRSERSQLLGRTILDKPGSRQKELCGTLSLTRKVFRHQINMLIAAGLVVEQRGPKIRKYQPSDLLRNVLSGPMLGSEASPTGPNGHPEEHPLDANVGPAPAGENLARDF